jgi:hypothetical protein
MTQRTFVPAISPTVITTIGASMRMLERHMMELADDHAVVTHIP